MDCAYSDGENIKYAEDGGFGFVCAFAGAGPGIRLHGAESQKGRRALVTFYNQGIKKKNLPFYFKERLRMRDKMSSPEGRRIYNMRKTGLEPVYGNLKANLCFREFLLRGLEKVRVEVNLACIAHNPQKIHRMAGEKMAASA